MQKINVGWMYPNLLNLHGERGSLQALATVGEKMGLSLNILRIESFDDPIPFSDLDLLVFLPGELTVLEKVIPILASQKDALDSFIHSGKHLLAIGTSGLIFGRTILREDTRIVQGLGYLDMDAKERKYIWGDDLHIRLLGSKQELVGSQIQMADVSCATPLAQTLYGMGNNNTGTDGGRYRNLIYTNCLGPLFVKNPWFAQDILKDICLHKFLGLQTSPDFTIPSDSFDSTLRFIEQKK